MFDEMFKKVLIIEDDLDFRDSLRDSLSAQNFAVSTADDGEQAMERLLAHRPDVVILDLLLPKVHGFEVLKRIRAYPDEVLAKTPVVILSNLSSQTDVEKGQELGANAYFVKSRTKNQEVVNKVKEILFGSANVKTEEVWDFSKG
jgi:DNA-binding response OmpR family regulator